MTDDKDRRLLLSLLSIFYSWELIKQECCQLCEDDLYYVPAHGPYEVRVRAQLHYSVMFHSNSAIYNLFGADVRLCNNLAKLGNYEIIFCLKLMLLSYVM